MTTGSLRTQILLPPNLRQMIDLDRKQKEESLSEYLRKAARSRLQKNKRDYTNLKNLAQKLIGALDLSKYPEWSSRKKVNLWQRALRHEKGL